MTAENTSEESANEGLDQRHLSIQGSVDESTVVVGDHNTISYHTNVFGTFETEQFPVRLSQPLNKDEYRWRQVLVQNVKRYWIEGVLEKSLHNQALIELGLEERAQAVALPIGAAEEFAADAGRPYPAGTQATDIFDGLGAGRTLLILGEPGAGKTTMLLKLTKTLIARISDDLSQPIPVVLNLSSWAKKRKSIAEWLVQDLYETFQVSKVLGTTWIKEEQLTLCLDGLDEVASEHRDDCLKALNQFMQAHGRTEVVVCSRIRDYEALSERLKVKCAVYVQPLTDKQINQYLEQSGEQLSYLTTIFTKNAEIKAFATSPLILSVMSLAYQDYSFCDFPNIENSHFVQGELFDIYIERMFQRRGRGAYEREQTRRWLVWIAQQMVKSSQTIFFVEDIQPSWLKTRDQQRRYRIESSFFVALIGGLFIGASIGLNSGLNETLHSRLSDGLVVGLGLGLMTGLGSGLVCGLIAMMLGEIKPVETLRWSRKNIKKPLCISLSIGAIAGLLFSIGGSLTDGLLLFWLIGGLIVGLCNGLRGPQMSYKTEANHGIWRSARSAGMFALYGGIVFGLMSGLLFGFNEALGAGLSGGVVTGLVIGGSACIRHFSLRLMIYRMTYAPWNYARFLSYAAELLFLQKVGGGYIFIHRMLLEHFAQMNLEQKRSN